MFSDDAFTIVISIIIGIIIAFTLLSLGSFLIAQYAKNNRLLTFCYSFLLGFTAYFIINRMSFMLSDKALTIVVSTIVGISIIFILLSILGSLLVRYTKNYRLIASYYTCFLFVAPWYAFGYGNRGFARLQLKEHDKAMRDCNRAIKLNSNLYWVYNNRGVLHMQAQRYQEAFIEFERSIKLKPDYRLPYFNSVHINIKLKNYEQALRNIEAYIAIKGKIKDAAVYCSRGAIYSYLKEYTRALQDFDHSLELNPDFALAHHNKGFILLMINQVQQGFESIMRALTLNPRNILFNWTFEWCKMCVEQPNNTTIEHLEALAKLEPESHTTYTSRGAALWLRGNFEAAVKELEQAIALEPRAEDAYFWVSMAYASMGHDEEALVALREAKTIGVPGVLMTPLYLLEKTQPAFFEKYAKEFLTVQGSVSES